ncbi:cyclase family protein [Sphingomonas sp.]|uniref:cyclase family protein n=1 Tax=Sphingomonas sp. TaxID=28214 RepID=UPI003CC56243
MAGRLIDLPVTIENDVPADPPGAGPQIAYHAHRDTVAELAASFAGLTAADLPDGEGWAVERAQLSTHNGTHIDAPYHYASTQDGALPGGTRPLSIPRGAGRPRATHR